jgi:hypothetical protein
MGFFFKKIKINYLLIYFLGARFPLDLKMWHSLDHFFIHYCGGTFKGFFNSRAVTRKKLKFDGCQGGS